MKPVTELYEAADVVATHGCDESRRADLLVAALAFEVEGCKPNTPMLEVLDLVATLPPERLGLVRWVVGLTASDCALLRWSIADGTCNAMARVLPEDSQRLRAMFSGLHVALSGGEGGKKCPECHGAGKVKRLEGSGSVRVVKYDPCPKCTAGGHGEEDEATHPMWGAVANTVVTPETTILPAEESRDLEKRMAEVRAKIRSYDGGDRPSSPPMRLFEEEPPTCTSSGCKSCGFSGGCDEDATLTILPAGKPPPFLRVGMVWRTGVGHDRVRLIEMSPTSGGKVQYVDTIAKWTSWVPATVLLSWPLAEPFTVEGES